MSEDKIYLQALNETQFERNYDTMAIVLNISKQCENLINEFARIHNIEYDEAAEILIRVGASTPNVWS